jgi:anti-sigma factor RsiW
MSACDDLREAMPWYVNGTLAISARAAVDEHLRTCAACRAEVDLEHRLANTMQTGETRVVPSPHAGWQQLVARLDALEQAAEHESDTPAVRRPRAIGGRLLGRRVLLVAVAAQAVALVFLAVALWRAQTAQTTAAFYTLTRVDPTLAWREPLVRVAFARDVSPADAQRVAQTIGVRTLAGPSPGNVYTFSVGDRGTAATLEAFRRSSGVLLAEPVQATERAR